MIAGFLIGATVALFGWGVVSTIQAGLSWAGAFDDDD